LYARVRPQRDSAEAGGVPPRGRQRQNRDGAERAGELEAGTAKSHSLCTLSPHPTLAPVVIHQALGALPACLPGDPACGYDTIPPAQTPPVAKGGVRQAVGALFGGTGLGSASAVFGMGYISLFLRAKSPFFLRLVLVGSVPVPVETGSTTASHIISPGVCIRLLFPAWYPC
jgi:hypothetical protein